MSASHAHAATPAADASAPDWSAVCATAAAHADAVDREGRFPAEAVLALKANGALSSAVPQAYGGAGTSMVTLARMARDLGAACASTGMVFAMHHNQLACLIHHHQGAPWQEAFLRKVASQSLLLASVTSEEGIGGRLRTSRCAVETLPAGRFRLEKDGSTISYGAEADAYLVTARATPEAEPSDQVLVVMPRESVTLEPYRPWDALGLRGTGSGGFRVKGEGEAGQIVPAPFGEIAAETMVPSSHILWGAVWLGIASDVVARTRAFLRARMRARSGAADPGLARLAQMTGMLQDMDARLRHALDIYEARLSEPEAVEMILLKTQLSETALAVVTMAMRVVGFAGYCNNTPFSLGRHLRDLNAAPLMIGNEAILADAGQLLLVRRPDLGNFDGETQLS